MNPELSNHFRRFRNHRRAFYSLCALALLFVCSLASEWIASDQPLLVAYQNHYYFPVFRFHAGSEFGDPESRAPDYKALRNTPSFQKNGGWMIFPPLPYGPNESLKGLPSPPPSQPTTRNWLGTDDRGRDLFTRLIYGFRNSMLFALVSWCLTVTIAFAFGAVQGYIGGRVDLILQRFTEVWNALPLLFIIIFLLSLFPSGLVLLTLVWVAFAWVPLSTYIRAEVLRVRKNDYVMAANAIGISLPRLLFRHILPNSLTPIVTLSPFLIAASIGSLAALDYLGLGLPPPAASWGELLREGKENLLSWWLVLFPFLSLFGTLILLNFIGEGVRSAFGKGE